MYATDETQKFGYKGMRFVNKEPLGQLKKYPKGKAYETCWWTIRPQDG